MCAQGLPGAVDYALLCGVKTGRVPRMREKQFNTAINTWLRIPGLVCVGAFAWCCLAHGMAERLPTLVLVVSIALSLANGLYYGEQVIGSYHAERALQKMAGGGANGEVRGDALRFSRGFGCTVGAAGPFGRNSKVCTRVPVGPPSKMSA